jgi:hypothetical protein
VGPGGPQLLQQPGDLPRIIDVDLARRIAVEQGLNRLGGPGGAQFLCSLSRVGRVAVPTRSRWPRPGQCPTR